MPRTLMLRAPGWHLYRSHIRRTYTSAATAAKRCSTCLKDHMHIFAHELSWHGLLSKACANTACMEPCIRPSEKSALSEADQE